MNVVKLRKRDVFVYGVIFSIAAMLTYLVLGMIVQTVMFMLAMTFNAAPMI